MKKIIIASAVIIGLLAILYFKYGDDVPRLPESPPSVRPEPDDQSYKEKQELLKRVQEQNQPCYEYDQNEKLVEVSCKG